jgi:hypothetical protein
VSSKTLTKGMQAMAKGMQVGRMQGRNVRQAGRHVVAKQNAKNIGRKL